MIMIFADYSMLKHYIFNNLCLSLNPDLEPSSLSPDRHETRRERLKSLRHESKLLLLPETSQYSGTVNQLNLAAIKFGGFTTF